jgi:hypothetical protein
VSVSVGPVGLNRARARYRSRARSLAEVGRGSVRAGASPATLLRDVTPASRSHHPPRTPPRRRPSCSVGDAGGAKMEDGGRK